MQLGDIVALFGEHLWLPDLAPLYATLGAVVAGQLPGPPVWLLLIGPPSSGKTVLLDALVDLPSTYSISTFSQAGLLSAAPDGTPGLLPMIGEWGRLIFADFTTILSQPREARDNALGPMREVYDGRFVRVVGNRIRPLEWSGKVNLVGACTEAIYTVDMSLLGERLTYVRMPEATHADRFLAAITTLERLPHLREQADQRRETVTKLVADLTIPEESPALSSEEQDRLVTIGQLGATCRTKVLRDGFKADVIELVPEVEHPARFVAQLGQLLAGMRVVGVADADAWRVVSQSCLDSVQPIRRKILRLLATAPREHATALIAGRCHIPETTARRQLQDLEALGIIELVHHDPDAWRAGDWLRDSWAYVTLPASPPTPVHPSFEFEE